MKLYVESTQAKLDELEKNNDPTKAEGVKKELEALKQEKVALHEKISKREAEIDMAKKELRSKADTIANLEKQVETIGPLKNKIKELEKILTYEGNTKSASNTLKIHNGTSKPESENYSKTINLTNVRRVYECWSLI